MPTRTQAELSAAERAYHANPNNEETCRALIAAYQSAGRRNEALELCLLLSDRLEAAGTLPTAETRQLMNALAAAPKSVPRESFSRRRLLQAAALGSVFGVSAGVWQWAQHPASAIAMRSAQSWNEEGDQCGAKAVDLYHHGQYRLAGEKAARAIECYRQSHNGAGEANITLLWGETEQARGAVRVAQNCFAQGLELSRTHSSNPHAVAHALELCGTLAVRQGRYADAQKLFDESITLSWQKDEIDKGNVLAVMCSQGLLAAARGRSADADWIYRCALEYARSWNKNGDRDPMIACLQMLQGTLAMNQGDFWKSETLLTEAKTYWESQKNASPRWKALVYNRLAAVALWQNAPDVAQTYLALSLPTYLSVEDKFSEAETRMLRGRLFLMQSRLDAAETELQAAQTYFESEDLLPRAARCHLVLSALRTAQDRPQDSHKELERAEKLLAQTHTVLTQTERNFLRSVLLR